MNGAKLSEEMESLKSRLRDTWISGDFGVIAKSIEKGAEEFVDRLPVESGQQVLDIACGTGNLSLPAAVKGAAVTGVDIAPNLIDQAIERAKAAGVEAKFEVGDAEALPYADGSFDAVITMFGAMFAPRPDVTAAEMIRVTKKGGIIAMANWTSEGFTGDMFKMGAKHAPPPAGMPSPLMWGSEEIVKERLSSGITDLKLERRPIEFLYPISPAEVVERFRLYFGPTHQAFNSLDEQGQNALRSDLEELWRTHNTATDGTTRVVGEYLEVVATRG